MLKSIKKSFKYLMILVGIGLLVPTFFSLIFSIPEVQTFIVRRVTGYLSDQIKSTISLGRVEYSFFNRISINDLLIKDQNSDTLVYIQKVSAGISRLDFRNNIIRLGHVEIVEPSVALITDTSGVMNLTRFLDLLRSPENNENKRSSVLNVRSLTIREGKFMLENQIDSSSRMMINFNNLLLTGINGDIDDLLIHNDSTTFRINNLQFAESGGFLVRSLNSRVAFAEKDIIFSDLFLYRDSSILNADHIIIAADSADSFRKFTDEVRLDIELQKSLISSADLKYFVQSVKKLDLSLQLSGKVSGTVAELKGRNIMASFGIYTNLDCDFDFSGLPQFEDAFIHIRVNSLNTNVKDFEKLRFPKIGNPGIPEALYKLGNISFNGNFTGFLTDFVTYGKIGTEVGNISTDISLRPDEKNRFRIKGLVDGSNIDIGLLTDKRDLLGKISMKANIDGLASSSRKISGSLTGKIDSIEINRYIYRNVALNGTFTEKTWDGSIKISDRNIRMDMLGLLDFSNTLPEFDFTLNLAGANLYKLNFVHADSIANLAMLVTANFRGNNIDNLFGEIRLLNSTLVKNNDKLELYDFSIKAFNEDSKPAISLRTDFLDADLRGYYEFGEIRNVIKRALASLMPSRFDNPAPVKNHKKNAFTFALNFKNTDKINRFFRTGILMSDKSIINGKFFQDSILNITVYSKMFNYRNNVFNNLAISSDYLGTNLTATLKSTSFSILGLSDLKNFKSGFRTVPDNFIFDFDWDNKEEILNKGAFTARGSFSRNESGQKGIQLKIKIDSSEVYASNNLWKIKESAIMKDSSSTQIDKLTVTGANSSYSIDGTLSGNSDDTLKLEFIGIDLSPLNQLKRRKKDDTDPGIPFNPKGIVNGYILISSALKNPMIESNIAVRDFSILSGEFGDISVKSVWNPKRKVADINASNNLYGKKNLDVNGFYDPEIKKFNLTGRAENLPIDALSPILDFFASGISGTVSGKVNLAGAPGRLILKGALMAENASMKINYLQTSYKLNDSIRFDETGIKFRNLKISDEKGNFATLSGSVFHKYFSVFSVDLIINMDKNDFFVLNTQQRDNELFYGTAYGTGVTSIKSGPNMLSFDISAKTGKGTKVNIPLNSGMEISKYSFVTFAGTDSVRKEDNKKALASQLKSSDSGLELNFDLNVTPDAEVQLLIDPKAGDVIRGRGAGNLNISLNKKGEFKIYGDYIIDDGDYLFTLQNILNKRFDVENGGKVIFNGDVENAEIDLTAKYRNLKTSLYPILQDDRYNNRIPVEPQLILSGNLFNPVVGFNIYLPTADEETRTYLRNAIVTEEELSKQFLYLLVMNSFYSDPSYHSSAGSSSVSGTSAMAVTTTEMLSNQLSNWLSQISNDFDIGFVYRPGNKEINSQELQVALSTQLLNDKVTINGNFDYRGAGNPEGTPLSGDFDVEYKITEKIRFKVFNRYNNPYTGRNVQYTQGLGIFFKKDFNRFSDLLRKKESSDLKKEDEITIQ